MPRNMKIKKFCPATTKMNMGKISIKIGLSLLFSMLFRYCNSKTYLEVDEEHGALGAANVTV